MSAEPQTHQTRAAELKALQAEVKALRAQLDAAKAEAKVAKDQSFNSECALMDTQESMKGHRQVLDSLSAEVAAEKEKRFAAELLAEQLRASRQKTDAASADLLSKLEAVEQKHDAEVKELKAQVKAAEQAVEVDYRYKALILDQNETYRRMLDDLQAPKGPNLKRKEAPADLEEEAKAKKVKTKAKANEAKKAKVDAKTEVKAEVKAEAKEAKEVKVEAKEAKVEPKEKPKSTQTQAQKDHDNARRRDRAARIRESKLCLGACLVAAADASDKPVDWFQLMDMAPQINQDWQLGLDEDCFSSVLQQQINDRKLIYCLPGLSLWTDARLEKLIAPYRERDSFLHDLRESIVQSLSHGMVLCDENVDQWTRLVAHECKHEGPLPTPMHLANVLSRIYPEFVYKPSEVFCFQWKEQPSLDDGFSVDPTFEDSLPDPAPAVAHVPVSQNPSAMQEYAPAEVLMSE